MTLNKLPESPKKLEEMNETEVNAWLRNIDFTKMNTLQPEYDITVSPVSNFCKNMQVIKKLMSSVCHYRLKTTRHFLGQLHYLRHLENLIFLVKIWFSILNLTETKGMWFCSRMSFS